MQWHTTRPPKEQLAMSWRHGPDAPDLLTNAGCKLLAATRGER